MSKWSYLLLMVVLGFVGGFLGSRAGVPIIYPMMGLVGVAFLLAKTVKKGE